MQTEHTLAGPRETRREVHPVAAMHVLFAFFILHFALLGSLQ
jgi:hypothetical protein